MHTIAHVTTTQYTLRVPTEVAVALLETDEAALPAHNRADPQAISGVIEVVGAVADTMEIVIGAATLPVLVKRVVAWFRARRGTGDSRSEPGIVLKVQNTSGQFTEIEIRGNSDANLEVQIEQTRIILERAQ